MEYSPFGLEWEKEMMQLTKPELIKLLRNAWRPGSLQEADFDLWLRGLRGKICLAGCLNFTDCEHYEKLIANKRLKPTVKSTAA